MEVPVDIEESLNSFNDFTIRCFEKIYTTGEVPWVEEGTKTCVDVALEVAGKYGSTNDPLNYYEFDNNGYREYGLIEGLEIPRYMPISYYYYDGPYYRIPLDIVTYFIYGMDEPDDDGNYPDVNERGKFCSKDGELIGCLDKLIDTLGTMRNDYLTRAMTDRLFKRVFSEEATGGWGSKGKDISYGLDIASARCTSRDDPNTIISCFEKVLQYNFVPTHESDTDRARMLVLNSNNDYISPHCQLNGTPINCFDKYFATYKDLAKPILSHIHKHNILEKRDFIMGKNNIPISTQQWVLEHYQHYMGHAISSLDINTRSLDCKREDGTPITCLEKVLDLLNSSPKEYSLSRVSLARDLADRIRYHVYLGNYDSSALLCTTDDGNPIHCLNKFIEIPSKYSELRRELLGYNYDYRTIPCFDDNGNVISCYDKIIDSMNGIDILIDADANRAWDGGSFLLQPVCHDAAGNAITCLDKIVQRYNEYAEAKSALAESKAALDEVMRCAESGDAECKSMLPSYRAQVRELSSGAWAISTLDAKVVFTNILERSDLDLITARCSKYYGREHSGTTSCFEKIIQLYEEYPDVFGNHVSQSMFARYSPEALGQFECEGDEGQRVTCMQRVLDMLIAAQNAEGIDMNARSTYDQLMYTFILNNDMTKRNFVLPGVDGYVTGIEYLAARDAFDVSANSNSMLPVILMAKGNVPDTVTINGETIPIRDRCCEGVTFEKVQKFLTSSNIVPRGKSSDAIALEIVGNCMCKGLEGSESRSCHDKILWDWARADRFHWYKDDPEWGMTNLSDPYGICGVYEVKHTFRSKDLIERYLNKVRAAKAAIESCDVNGQIVEYEGAQVRVQLLVDVPTVDEMVRNALREPMITLRYVSVESGNIVREFNFTFNSVLAKRSSIPALKNIPTIRDLINGVATGKPSSKTQNLKLVISRRPYDMMRASTGQHWSSCFNMKSGSHANSIGLYMNYDGYIAYLAEDEFDPIWKMRAWILPTVDNETGAFLNCFRIQKNYGLPEYDAIFTDSITKVLYDAGYTCTCDGCQSGTWGWIYDKAQAQAACKADILTNYDYLREVYVRAFGSDDYRRYIEPLPESERIPAMIKRFRDSGRSSYLDAWVSSVCSQREGSRFNKDMYKWQHYLPERGNVLIYETPWTDVSTTRAITPEQIELMQQMRGPNFVKRISPLTE